MHTGRITIPTDKNFVEGTKILIKKWGADAVRDCDGTQLPAHAKELADKVYNTYFVIRGDYHWAISHKEEWQHLILMTPFITATDDILKIDPMRGYFKEQVAPDYDSLKYWEVIDRTNDSIVENWTIENGQVIVKNVKKFHEYTLSFLAISLWDPVHMYNSLTNGWKTEHHYMYDPFYPQTNEYTEKHLQQWCDTHKETNVVRFTTFIYQFTLVFNEKGKEKYVDWFGYSMAVSPKMLDAFEEKYGYKMRAEFLTSCGTYNNPFQMPSKEFLDYREFVEDFVNAKVRRLTDIVHRNGKEAMMFLGDCWIGAEIYGKNFKNMNLDAVVGSIGGGVTVRMLSDIQGVKYVEGRFLPYFFPDTFFEGNEEHAVAELNRNWITARRAMMRSPLDRIGYGGYLSLAAKFPKFVERVAEICNEFRDIYSAVDAKKPYSSLKVAVLNSWGKIRSWQCFMVAHELWYQQIYSYQGILESLSGLPVEVEFINFEDVKKGALNDYDCIINAGDRDTAWSGGENWIDEKVITKVKEYIYNGGGFIGIGEPSAVWHNGKLFQLSSALGVEEELGFTLSQDKYNIQKEEKHFITEDIKEEMDYGEDKKNIYALDGTKVLDIKISDRFKRNVNVGEVKMAIKEYGKGRSFYLTGLPYSFQNSRLLYRAMLWTAGKESKLYQAFSSNIYTECSYYPTSKKYAIINNANEEQTTEFYDVSGNKQTLKLAPCSVDWIQ